MARKLQAVLFDCDGVLAETERDGHRAAYNAAFREMDVDACWSPGDYGSLLTVSGGKERMRSFFSSNPQRYPPDRFDENLIRILYERKTEIYREMCRTGLLPARPGIVRFLREAHAAAVCLFVCSTSRRESVEELLRADAGEESPGWFTDLLCGDIVPRKKPAPDIYNLAKRKFRLNPELCVVIEDSRNGLLAAKGAGMHCLVTPSFYTAGENFDEADAVVSSLGDPDGEKTRVLRQGQLRFSGGWIGIRDLSSLFR